MRIPPLRSDCPRSTRLAGAAILAGGTFFAPLVLGLTAAEHAGAAGPAPVVSATSPNSGPVAGGTSVTITGSGFTGATSVNFGATAATGVVVNSDNSITATSPALAANVVGNTVDVTVTTPNGTSATGVADEFTYTYNTTAAPTSNSVSISAPAAAASYVPLNTPVTVTATATSDTTPDPYGMSVLDVSSLPPGPTATLAHVTAGTTASSSPIMNSSFTQARYVGEFDHCTTLPCPPNPISLTGQEAVSAPVTVTWEGTPSVASVAPTSGPSGGGTAVSITGANFAGASSVMFGSTAASFTQVSPTSITAQAPAGSGTVDVKVTTPVGTSPTTAADQFTFTGTVAVSSVSPAQGRPAGGTSVTITGSGFTGATAVTFGATPTTSFTVNSDTSITVVSPAGTGTVDVTVTTPTGTSAKSAADQFRYVGGYDLVGSDGGVFVFPPPGSNSGFFGSLPGLGIHVSNVVGMVPSHDGLGYFLVGSDGGVFVFGDGSFVGSLPGLGIHVNNVVGIVRSHDDKGYFLVGSDGGVFVFGDGSFVGSLPGLGIHVNNIVGIAATSDDKGYWLVDAAGNVFAFGDANYYGGLGGSVASPVVGIVGTHDNGGYWLVTANGTVRPFGDAKSFGDLPTLGVNVSNIVSIVPTSDGQGYLLIGSDGGVFVFGDGSFLGSLPGLSVHVNNVVGGAPTS